MPLGDIPGAGRFQELDGLRAVAIGLVIASHALYTPEYGWISHLGHAGVMIFFALSGFLITNRLLVEYDATGHVSLRNFYVRRIFRILPAALAYLAVICVLAGTGLIVCSFAAIRAALFFYANYANLSETAWSVWHFWSLSAEEHFYVIWPCLLVLLGVRVGARTAALGVVVFWLWHLLDNHYHVLALLTGNPNFAHPGVDGRTDQVADVLLLGCCLAFYLRPPRSTKIGVVHSTIIAVVAAFLLVFFSVRGGRLYLPMLHCLPTFLLWAIVACPKAPFGAVLRLAPLRFIGKISYGLYIWQALFFGQYAWHLPAPIAVAALLTCTLASYTLVERPCMRIAEKLTAAKTTSYSLAAGA